MMMSAHRLSHISTVACIVFLALLCCPMLLIHAQPVPTTTTLTVTTLIDEDDGNALATNGAGTSLREAVLYSVAGDEVVFDASLSGTILLDLGELPVTHDLFITGPGSSVIDVNALGETRILNIASAVQVAMSGLTLSAGRALDGGAIASRGWLRIQDCALRTSTAVQNGGAIWHDGTVLALERCTVEFCTAYLDGGALAVAGGALTLEDSECGYNLANDEGGGLYLGSGVSATLLRSTLASNEARLGGGCCNNGALMSSHSTISSNTATMSGGGIYNDMPGAVTLDFCTIAFNSAAAGGGSVNMGMYTVRNSIHAENKGGTNPDALGSFNSAGYNLIQDIGASTGWSGTDLTGTASDPVHAALDGLFLNSGYTRTHALLICSEAIDAADPGSPLPMTDQRSLPRGVNGDNDALARSDIGAYEVQTVLDIHPPLVEATSGLIIILDSLTGTSTLDPDMLMPIIRDDCEIIAKTVSPSVVTCSDIGFATISLHVEDQSHNMWDSTMIVQVDDYASPTITPPDSAVLYLPADSCEIRLTTTLLGVPTTSDNCHVDSVGLGPSSTVSAGLTTVMWTAVDGEGNAASASQVVEVIDNTAPVATAPPDVTVNTGIMGCRTRYEDVPLGMPTVIEACSYTVENNAPAYFPLGETIVTWTVSDASGNTDVVTQKVTVEDHAPPTITAPPDLIRSTDPGSCDRLVINIDIGTPNVGDNCSVSTVTAAEPAVSYPIGTTDVVWTVTDGSGNMAQATQKITIIDNLPPSITAPADITVSADPGECFWTVNAAVLGTPTGVADNCSVPTATHNAGATLDVGVHRVLWTAMDDEGNFTTDVQLVTVLSPQPTISCPANILVNTDPGRPGAVVTYTVPVGLSTCPGVETIRTDGLGSGRFFPVGTTTEEYTVLDASNQTASCSFTVTVVDNEDPNITVKLAPEHLWPANNKLWNVYATVHASDNTDSVSIILVSISSNQPPDGPDIVDATPNVFDDFFQLRAKKANNSNRIYSVTYKAMDRYGNSATATATVTVPALKPKDYEIPDLPIPDGLELAQNYPNPFNPHTTISFGIPEAQHVRLVIYDAMGRAVRALTDVDLDAGEYYMTWDSRDDAGVQLPSGMYICRLIAGDQSIERKMLLAR